MTLKQICKWLVALWKSLIESRESNLSELEILREMIGLQGKTIELLLDLFEERFVGDNQSLHEIRKIIAAQVGISADFKRTLEKSRFATDQSSARLAAIVVILDRLNDD